MHVDREQEKPVYDLVEPGPPILMEHVSQAVKIIKRRKAEGSDCIVIEIVDVAWEIGIKKITELANRFYKSGSIPVKMKKSEFIAISKTK